MDFKSLSLFMQTSLAYECKVCKLYFGTENQLLAHHKGSHSKRLKVSIDPELRLVEDPDYHVVYQEEETSIQLSPENSVNTSGNNVGSKKSSEGEDSNVAKLQVKWYSSTTEESESSNGDLSEVMFAKRKSSQSQQQILNDNGDSSSNSCCEANENKGNDDEPALKKTKTEPDDSSSQICGTISKNNQELNNIAKPVKETTMHHHERSQSMKDTIEQGQYGYLTETGFHQFSLDDLKKFAVQVVALFKLDEFHHNLPSFTAASQQMLIPVIQNDVTTTSSMSTPFQGVPGSPISCFDNTAEGNVISRGQPVVDVEANIVGNSMEVPNKSCYKCGEPGHFAWGCANPRNREIQPKRKRQRRGRKKEKAELPAN